MKLFYQISKYLQIGLLLTFLLPFFPSGCKEGSAEIADSTNDVEAPVPGLVDTSAADSVSTLVTPIDTVLTNEKDTISSKQVSDKDESLTLSLVKKNPFLKNVLRPDNTYTGLGYIVEISLQTVMLSGVAISFLLWAFALIFKITKRKGFQLLNIIGLLLLYFTEPVPLAWFGEIKLWGYWVCFWWAAILILFDLVITSGKISHISND